jgi:hypothetical protein
MDATNEACVIGKIVKSSSHVDYVCQVFGIGEVEAGPLPTDYTFGTFVAIELDGGVAGSLVGVVYNTLLLNPEFGSLGPRLSPRSELEIFSPDYLAETATLIGIFAVGWRDAAGSAQQGVPALAAAVNSPVRKMTSGEFARFHGDADNHLNLRYAPLLLNQNNPLAAPLLMEIIDRLIGLFPASRKQLTVMRNNLAWRSIVQPAG